MDFTTLPLGTKVIWDRPGVFDYGFIVHITDDDQPIKVDFGDYYRWFTSDGRYNPDDDKPSLKLAELTLNSHSNADVSNAPLPDIWVQFMCASMSADYLVDFAAEKADLALEEYKKRFQ